MAKRQDINQERRSFMLVSAGAGVASMIPAAVARGEGANSWANEADIVVVGSGAAALSAAVAATKTGRSVVIFESGAAIGGTTSKSDGGYWIPNNRLMREKGLVDKRDDAIAFMLRHAYPASFNTRLPHLGVSPAQYDLIATFYDNAWPVLESLEKDGVLSFTGFTLIDYYDGAENNAPYGRTLLPRKPDGTIGTGRELIRQLSAWLIARKVPMLSRHRVTGILRNSRGEVIGVSADNRGTTLQIRARKAVIFGTGGYSQNPDLVTRFQPGPIYGGCAVPTNQGDFIHIGITSGAMLGNMSSAWRAPVVLEEVLQTRSVARDLFSVPGDSMLIVNKYGWRVQDEKRNYNDRGKVHYDWNVAAAEQSNRLLFIIYDRRTKEKFAGNSPIPETGVSAAHELRADTLGALGVVIQQRLDALADKIGSYPLDTRFASNLSAEVARFNSAAEKGVDSQFDRGGSRYDKEWHTGYVEVQPHPGWPDSATGNLTLYPLASAGPYFAVIIAPGSLDTNGGPQIDTAGRVLDTASQPIPGLYGAGNCIASPAGNAYWGAGTTLGLALTFGTLAGRAAAVEADKSIA